jgi:23S rRNA pseudouridine2605 synthase
MPAKVPAKKAPVKKVSEKKFPEKNAANKKASGKAPDRASKNAPPVKKSPETKPSEKRVPGKKAPENRKAAEKIASEKKVSEKKTPEKIPSTKIPAKPAPAEDEKLHKVLARAGMGSRREMERWITEGRVRINDRVAHLGDRIKNEDKVIVDGHALTLQAREETPRRVLIYNKPEGEICSRKDPEGRPTVFDSLPLLPQGRWIAIGRLDFNTTGLLLFTNDGDLANSMMHPSTQIDREYLVRVLGEVDDDMLKRLRKGVELDDGPARFSDITAGGGEGANKFFYVVIMEGRNREVRRLWESQGITVSRLKRVRYGNVFLPSRVKRGSWMEMPKIEVDELSKMVGLKPQANNLVTPQQKERFERQERRQQRTRTRTRPHEEYVHPSKSGTKARGAAKRRDDNADIERFGKPEAKRSPRKPAAQKTALHKPGAAKTTQPTSTTSRSTAPKPVASKPTARSKPDVRKTSDKRTSPPRKRP